LISVSYAERMVNVEFRNTNTKEARFPAL
jgi:hypothetical protein